ncbi:LuxR C-terminal-related transcriptional regulator [Streptosporangium sp. NPDC000509]|uniref:LuxR C-terminal-related transcriptional regulator n=1 Tax=Streptosporangium sp. NPDC000509 TaxID=3366186 RepID=UPI0036BD7B61
MGQEGLPRRWPLMGRASQLDKFDESLEDPRVRGFIVLGPRGAGKSRLIEECLKRAEGAGRRIGRAVATAAAASIPLGTIAHLLPAEADLSDPVTGFASVARLLSRPGTDPAPLVIVVDDLHLLDVTSVVLLRQLMDVGVIFLLGSVSSAEPPGAAVAALLCGDSVQQVKLVDFERSQVEELLEQVLGGYVGRNTVNQMFAASGGNPLYLRELVTGAMTGGILSCDGELWEMAPGRLPGTRRLTDLLRSRLSTASSEGRDVLEALALCEPLSVAQLTADAEPRTLDELERAGLIVIGRERQRTAVRLAHPLYGEVLRADITTIRGRKTLLRHLSLLERSGARRREDAMRLATYRLAATGTADPALLMRAAALAIHTRAYTNALSLLRAVPEEWHGVQYRLLLGKALYEAGEFEQAETVLSQAAALAGDEQETLFVTGLRVQNLIWGLGVSQRTVREVIEAARHRVASPSGHQVLTATEAAGCFALGEFPRSLALCSRLPLDSGPGPDVMTWLIAVTTTSATLAFLGRCEEAVTWARRATSVSAAVDAELYSMTTHEAAHQSILMLALTESGHLAESRTVGEQAYRTLAQGLPSPEQRLLAFQLGRTAWLAGHPGQARRWYAELVRAARPYTAILLPLALSGLAASAALQGDLQAAEAALTEYDRLTCAVHIPEERLGVAWLHAVRGELSQARAVLTAAAQDARERGQIAFESVLLTDLVRLGGAGEAAERLAEIAEATGGRFHRARAHLAAAWAEECPDRLLTAADEMETIGADLLAAEAACVAAGILRQAGDSRRAQAAALRAQLLAARCEGARTPALTTGGSATRLTRRQQEIALLVSQGMPRKDIAEQLGISVRTVDNHLQRIYAELGITTRRELATRLNGVVPSARHSTRSRREVGGP